MAGAVGVALSLAKYVPELIGMFDSKRGEQAQGVMQAVSSVAEAVTGKTGDAAVDAINADPNLALEFKTAVMADKHVTEQLALEDKKSAREAYKVQHEQADKIAERIMKWNLPALMMMAVIQAGVIWVAKMYDLDVAVVAIVSNLLGLVVKSLLDERLSVVNFFFGSSLGSKMKKE